MSASSNRQSERVRVTCIRIVRETKAAICVEVEKLGEVWIPLSQVHSIHKTTFPYLFVTPWIARQKSLPTT